MMAETRKTRILDQPGYNALWGWFGLSYATFLTLPRVLMHEMPDEWQGRMAKLLEEFTEEFPNTLAGQTQVRRTKGAWPAWLLNYRHPDRSAIEQARR
jgi:hypothetical protein